MTVRIALPTGEPRSHVASLLRGAGLDLSEYEPGSRVMRSSDREESVRFRIFRERDIPVQLALGNYDLGVCSDLYVAEHQARFPLERVGRLGGLPGSATSLWLAAAPGSGIEAGKLPPGSAMAGARIVSEFPNIADNVAVRLRIPRYRLLHVAGAVEAYPPVDADLAIVQAADSDGVRAMGLVAVTRVFTGGLALFGNSDALSRRDLGEVLASLAPLLAPGRPRVELPDPGSDGNLATTSRNEGTVRLAIPDGHAQRHAPAVLRAAGIELQGYDEQGFVREPRATIPCLEVKVVRPQDMPQLVALGMFDIAISGRDLLHEHLCRFPGSPVEMAVDLGTNRYKIGPVVDQAFPAETTGQAIVLWNSLDRPLRITSEFPATAEQFARDHHLRYTTIIPIAGASEGFVPEDADVLVEGTETGTSIRANGLKMLDPFMESTSCVLVRREPATTATKLLAELVDSFRQAARSSD